MRLLSLMLGSALLVGACSGGGEVSTTTFGDLTTGSAEATTAPSTTPSSIASTSVVVTTTTVPTEEGVTHISVVGGVVEGGPAQIEAALGSELHIVVLSDVADHVHVHGYDLFFELAPGESIDIVLTVDVPGVFEMEMEETGLLIAEIEVS